jgi:hypothetical protein
MKRSLFNILAAVSALLFIGVVVIWAGTYRTARVGTFPRDESTVYFVASHGGKLELAVQTLTPPVTGPRYEADIGTYGRLAILCDGNTATATTFAPHHAQEGSVGFGKSRYRGRFAVGPQPTRHAAEARAYFVPYWALLLVAAVAPGVFAWGHYRAHGRSRRGLCAACGYDLRATPGRCPECGEEAGSSARMKLGHASKIPRNTSG